MSEYGLSNSRHSSLVSLTTFPATLIDFEFEVRRRELRWRLLESAGRGCDTAKRGHWRLRALRTSLPICRNIFTTRVPAAGQALESLIWAAVVDVAASTAGSSGQLLRYAMDVAAA
jgi:hypothetical protein